MYVKPTYNVEWKNTHKKLETITWNIGAWLTKWCCIHATEHIQPLIIIMQLYV